LQRGNQVLRRELTVAVPISVRPSGVVCNGILVLALRKSGHKIARVEPPVQVRIARAGVQDIPEQEVDVERIDESVPIEIPARVLLGLSHCGAESIDIAGIKYAVIVDVAGAC